MPAFQNAYPAILEWESLPDSSWYASREMLGGKTGNPSTPGISRISHGMNGAMATSVKTQAKVHFPIGTNFPNDSGSKIPEVACPLMT
jgi:hypothetical protein